MANTFFKFIILFFIGTLINFNTAFSEEVQKKEKMPFPHKAHFEVIQKRENICLACHPFLAIDIEDKKLDKELNDIMKKPGKEICHSCHMLEKTASSQCVLCHRNMNKILPESHAFDYIEKHVFDAKINSKSCDECHTSPSFCTNCHFKRNGIKNRTHKGWYLNSHGIEARIKPHMCDQCHKKFFCTNCHKGKL